MTSTTATPATKPDLVQALIAALGRRPFQPFVIVTRDGKRHRVTRANQAGTNDVVVGIIDNKDRMTYFKMHDVIEIEPIKSRRRGDRGGKSR
jgi:hypothetical protein